MTKSYENSGRKNTDAISTSGTELASAAVHGTSSNAPEELEKLQRLSARNSHLLLEMDRHGWYSPSQIRRLLRFVLWFVIGFGLAHHHDVYGYFWCIPLES